MKRLALLLPLLALAAAPARAEDPATRSPVTGKSHAEFAEVAEAATNGVWSPIAMRDVLASRTPGERGRALAKYGAGGGDATVMRALRWLRTVQCEDGSWPGNPVASTALAVWAFLCHNETPGRDGEFGSSVKRALEFLAADVDPETGLFRSSRGEPLAQPLGAFAIAIGYSMTRDPLLRDTGPAAYVPLLAGQRPDGVWNADPLDSSPEGRGDPRMTAVCALALRVALAWTAGTAETKPALCRACDALEAILDSDTGAALRTDGLPDPATPAIVYALQKLGRYNVPGVRKAIQFLDPCVYSWEAWDGPQPCGKSPTPLRDWLFVTDVKFQTGGSIYGAWNKQFYPETRDRQIVVPAEDSGYLDLYGKPREIGWWDSPSAAETGFCSGGAVLSCKRWSGGECLDGETTLGDRVRDTCVAVIPQMVYYAFSPTDVFAPISVSAPPVEIPHPKTNNATVRLQIRRKSPATNAPATPATHAESAEGAKEPAP